MSNDIEVPQASDPFEKKVAITIAVIAVVLSFISMRGDNAKTDAIIKTNEATNRWGQFQANSLKGHLAEMEVGLLKNLSSGPVNPEKLAELGADIVKYDTQKADIRKLAETLQTQAAAQSKENERCDFSALFLQVAIVICSLAILSRLHLFWFIGLGLAGIGVVKFFS